MAERAESHASEGSTTSSKGAEGTSQPHHQWAAYRGPVLFTGPSGLRDYRAHLPDHPHAVGIGDRSQETTSDLAYLSRGAPGSAFPLAKNGRIGEIGWPVETFKIVKGI
ncbi:protein SPMIP2-like [Babylonia areolata]|uniref:protein SPMIP2-like n=1 Tax=Babylonia areolata TaxID=304850 RepID=UPI003FD1BAD5